MSDSNNELYWINGLSYQIENAASLRNSTMQASGIVSKRILNELCSIHHEFAVTQYTLGACVQWSESGHNADKQLTVLGTRCVTLWPWYGQFEVWLLQPPQVPVFLGWPKCWFQEINISTMYRHILLDLNLLLDIGIHHRLQICIVNSCHGSMSWSRVSFASWSTISLPSMPQ